VLHLHTIVSGRRAEPPPASKPAPVSADELERLVRTLQDESATAKLVEQLRALIAAQRGAEKEKPAAAALFGQLSQQVDTLSEEILASAGMIVDAPRLLGWARQQVSDVAARHSPPAESHANHRARKGGHRKNGTSVS
jgi:moderate conductance mechanosensitive channel